jgi:DNA-binding beta-propeller fold protein YncE
MRTILGAADRRRAGLFAVLAITALLAVPGAPVAAFGGTHVPASAASAGPGAATRGAAFHDRPAPQGSGGTNVSYATLLSTIDVGSLTNNTTGGLPKFDTALDPASGYLYVAMYGFDTVSIVSDANNTLIATPRVQADPAWTTYDPADGYVYATNFQSNSVSILSGTRVFANLSLPNGPRMSMYDPGDGDIYTVDQGYAGAGPQEVSVLNGTRVVANLSLGTQLQPDYAVYAPVTQYVYVCDGGSDNVTILNGTHYVGNVSVGTDPTFGLFDPSNGLVYITDHTSSEVTVLKRATVVATLGVGSAPGYSAYDAANGWVYVPDEGSGNVTIINGTGRAGNASSPGSPSYALYDPLSLEVYVSNFAAGTVSVLQGSNDVANVSVGLAPEVLTFDPRNDEVYEPNEGSGTVSAIGQASPAYPVTFSEKGLPKGTGYTVDVGATLYEPTGAGVVAELGNGTYSYSVPTVTGWFAENGTGNVSVYGGPAWVNMTFVPTYPVQFVESGLPTGMNWSVTVAPQTVASTLDNLTIPLPNGTFLYRVGFVPGYRTASPRGLVTVSAGPTKVDLAFSTTVYPVLFEETGLPAGTPWTVTASNDTKAGTSTEIGFVEPNGSVPYEISAGPGFYTSNAAGVLRILGTGAWVNRTFVRAYPVVFSENGLAPGTSWSASIGTDANSSTSSTVVLDQPNGSHVWHLGPVPGYTTSAWSGTITVSGAARTVSVAFVPNTYAVVFQESGLPAGTAWAVEVNGTPYLSGTGAAADQVALGLANGTYPFVAERVPAWTPLVRFGSVTVDGRAVELNVTFVPDYPVVFKEVGLLQDTSWMVTIGPDSNRSILPTIVLDEPNGTWDWQVSHEAGYTAQLNGTVTVNGGRTDVEVVFLPVLYGVRFHETGLPSLTPWKVTLGAATNGSAGPSVGFAEANGTYLWHLDVVAGYTPSNATGRVVVDGSGVLVNVSFVRTTYELLVQEQGLPAGTSWGVRVGGVSGNTSSASLEFQLPNGTYNVTVLPVPGYDGPGPQEVSVAGQAPAPVNVTFTKPSSGGMSDTELAAIAGGIVAVAVVVALLLLLVRRRPAAPAAGPDKEPGPPEAPPAQEPPVP